MDSYSCFNSQIYFSTYFKVYYSSFPLLILNLPIPGFRERDGEQPHQTLHVGRKPTVQPWLAFRPCNSQPLEFRNYNNDLNTSCLAHFKVLNHLPIIKKYGKRAPHLTMYNSVLPSTTSNSPGRWGGWVFISIPFNSSLSGPPPVLFRSLNRGIKLHACIHVQINQSHKIETRIFPKTATPCWTHPKKQCLHGL